MDQLATGDPWKEGGLSCVQKSKDPSTSILILKSYKYEMTVNKSYHSVKNCDSSQSHMQTHSAAALA